MQDSYKFLNRTLAATAAIPLVIVLWACGHMLWIIWPDLDETQKAGLIDGLAVISLPGIASVASGIWFSRKKTTLSNTAVIGLTLLTIACFYTFFQYIQPHISFRDWMFDQDTYLGLVFSALIPLFYFLLYYLAENSAIHDRRGLIITIASSIVLPVIMYVAFNTTRLMASGGIFSTRIIHLVVISVTTAFSFMLIRLGTYVIRQKSSAFQKPAVVWGMQFVCVGVLPFVGLWLNAAGPVARESQAVLGNFTAREFWWLAGFNALLYLLPQPKNYVLHLALAGLRAAGLGFVLYFCAVFVLYLPLALLLIAAIGLGVLLLIPYITAAAQLIRLKADFTNLTKGRKKGGVIAVLAVGFLILPTATLLHIYAERSMLTQAIQYLERPPLKLDYRPQLDAGKLLTMAASRAPSRRGWRNDREIIPIYDTLYRSIVLDGAELSETIRKKIRLVFGGINEFTTVARPVQSTASLDEIAVSTIDEENSTLRIRVKNTQRLDAEFYGQIELPDNAFIAGHWLTIDGVEVPAQITTRSTAIWVYNRIVEARRDPSLIYYEGKNLLAWKIFPVPGNGFREARLKISHVGDVEMKVAGVAVRLSSGVKNFPAQQSSSGRTLLLPPAKNALTRKPYLHLIVNCSKDIKRDYFADAEAVANQLRLSLSAAKVSFVNDSISTRDFGSSAHLHCPETHAGFFADLAFRSVIYNQFIGGFREAPVIAVLSPRHAAHISPELSYLTAVYGDADGWLLHDGTTITAHAFSGRLIKKGMLNFPLPVREYHGKFYRQGPALALLVNDNSMTTSLRPNAGLTGLEQYYDYLLGDPGGRPRAVLTAVESGVMNPATGSIVLETDAQRRRLAELHKKTLNARHELDTGEQPRMSEPWTYLLLAIPVLFFLGRGKKKRV